ncbi:MAG TPA: peptide ABC transporter substrate-binding protein [Candidatus Limnocylindria bacterium]|jgi:oligopeptide transport system substrate-binding protein|nr:peptide ABC transporter substrate-binding protein [Candidatus Limnocylindria bacterium]
MKRLAALSLLVLLTIAACTPSTTGTASPSPGAAAKKTTLRLPEGAKPATMDPGISSGGSGLEQIQNMFEALAYVDQVTGEIKPGQAEKWTISPDGLTYTFNLRSGLKWSDGQALKASDFEYAWKRATDPATKSRYAQTLWPVKGAEAFGTGKGTAADMAVKATDDKTLVVTLERPAPFFMHLVATWTAYPVRKDTIDKNGDKWTLTSDSYISNGHYRMVEWKQEQSMTLEKNPNYWGENNGPDTVVWTLFDDQASKSVIAYEANEIDRAVLAGADITRAKNDAVLGKEVKKFERQGSQWIIMDTTNPPLNNLKVRQALSLATNAKQINEVVLKDAFFNSVSIVAPGVPGQKKENALGYDTTKAKQLMSEAGYPDGKGWPANVKFTFDGALSVDKSIAEAVQGMWKSTLGIDIVLEPMETKALESWRLSRKTAPFHFYISGWGSDYEDPNNWYNLLFHSKADFFYSHWKNAEFDGLLDQGLKENDAAKRKALYESADKMINSDAPYITVYHWARFDLIKPYIEGLYHYRVLGRVQAYLVRVKK